MPAIMNQHRGCRTQKHIPPVYKPPVEYQACRNERCDDVVIVGSLSEFCNEDCQKRHSKRMFSRRAKAMRRDMARAGGVKCAFPPCGNLVDQKSTALYCSKDCSNQQKSVRDKLRRAKKRAMENE